MLEEILEKAESEITEYFYYGLTDKENHSWGFIEENDARVTPDMVKLTYQQWQALLDGQSKGKEIVYYDGKVFTAEPGLYYTDDDGQWQKKTNEEFETEKAQAEAERVNKLTMTALDFITFLRQAGLTLEQINAYIESNLEIKTQLTYCQNVYCGVVKSFMPVTVGDLIITADMVEQAFKLKNGEQI